jgi:HK97 family phage major capsid protein
MIEGGLRNVSIRYRIHTVEVDKSGDERVIDWEPLEQSIVSIPADPTVGMGRAEEGGQSFVAQRIFASDDKPAHAAKIVTTTVRSNMDEDEVTGGKEETTIAATEETRAAPTTQTVTVTEREAAPNAIELERQRRAGIEKLCEVNNVDTQIKDYWIGAGLRLDQVADDLLKIIEERGNTKPTPIGQIGMSDNEASKFSMLRAIKAAVEKDWTHAGFELECSRAVAEKLNKAPDPTRFYVPFEVMNDQRIDPSRHIRGGQRDLDAATAGAGGYLVGTTNQGFIEMLRNKSVAFQMGVRRLSGLQGNVTVPRQSAAGTAYWLASESTQITESQQTFVQLALSPKTVGAYTEISRQLLLQSSPDAEGIVTADLAAVAALAADLAVLNGSGAAGQPEGIIQTTGIGSVTGGAATYAMMLEFQTDVATSNVTPSMGGYATNPATAAILMQKQRFSSTDTPLWQGNIWGGSLIGFPGMSSNQMDAGDVLFGDWQECVVGEWGVLEVEVNPFANFQAGIIGVRAMYSLDVAVRRPFAFSYATGVTAS